jgi:hypothetical protein
MVISYIFIIFIYIDCIYKFYIVLIFVIHTNFACFFVIIKLEFPPKFMQNAPNSSRNDVVQVQEHEANNED